MPRAHWLENQRHPLKKRLLSSPAHKPGTANVVCACMRACACVRLLLLKPSFCCTKQLDHSVCQGIFICKVSGRGQQWPLPQNLAALDSGRGSQLWTLVRMTIRKYILNTWCWDIFVSRLEKCTGVIRLRETQTENVRGGRGYVCGAAQENTVR